MTAATRRSSETASPGVASGGSADRWRYRRLELRGGRRTVFWGVGEKR
ncbi:hypothetical protein LINPERPRIM_LOCUS6264 [Linum perenne]